MTLFDSARAGEADSAVVRARAQSIDFIANILRIFYLFDSLKILKILDITSSSFLLNPQLPSTLQMPLVYSAFPSRNVTVKSLSGLI